MDATHEVVVQGADGRLGGDASAATRAQTVRMVSWVLAWGLPVVSLIIGIVLTSVGSVEVWEDYSDGMATAYQVAVWPAGITLMAAGLAGLMAVAIINAVRASAR